MPDVSGEATTFGFHADTWNITGRRTKSGCHIVGPAAPIAGTCPAVAPQLHEDREGGGQRGHRFDEVRDQSSNA